MMNDSMRRFLKGLIVFKVILIAVIIGLVKNWIQIGDRPIFAEEKAKVEESGAAKEKTAAEATTTTTETAPAQKSILSDLLELPTLAPNEVEKAEIGRYMGLAERKRAQLEERVTQLKEREDSLRSLEKTIEEKIKLLEQERNYFMQTVQREKELKEERLNMLIAFYKKMEAKKAAAVFEKMDRDLVVQLFKSLPEKQIMNILGLMKPDKSVELTEYFSRIKSGKEYDILKEMNVSLQKEFAQCKPEKATDPTDVAAH